MRPDIHPHADPDQQTLLPQGKSLPCPEAPILDGVELEGIMLLWQAGGTSVLPGTWC